MIEDVLRNINLYADGQGYAGKISELTPPKLALKTDEYRAGGMDTPVDIDMGTEALNCDFTLTSYDRQVLKKFGLAPGEHVGLTCKGALVSEDGNVTPVSINMRGIWKEVDMGTWKPGEKGTLKVTVNCRYYKLTHNLEVLVEIDVEQMIRVVNGVDQLARIRAALGM